MTSSSGAENPSFGPIAVAAAIPRRPSTATISSSTDAHLPDAPAASLAHDAGATRRRHVSTAVEVGVTRPLDGAVGAHERVVHAFARAAQRRAPAEQPPAELGPVAHLAADAHDRDGAVLAARAVDEPPAARLGLGRREDRVPGGGQCCSFQSAPADVPPWYVREPTPALTGKSQRGGVRCGTVRRPQSFSPMTP